MTKAVQTELRLARRMSRLVEQEAMDGAKAYKPAEFLADLRKGIWKELDTQNVRIDAYRRNLQRGYLELISQKLNGRVAVADDERPLLRGELKSLNTQISQVLPRATDRTTRLHLEDVRDQIAKALDPKFQATAPASTLIPTRTGVEDSCWPDYAIK